MCTYLEAYACGHRRHRPRLTHPQISHLTKHPLHSWQHIRQNHDQVKENMPSKSTPAPRIALVAIPHRQQQSHQMTCQGRRQDAALHPPAQAIHQPIKTLPNQYIKQENNALNLIIFFKGVHWHTHHSKQIKLLKKIKKNHETANMFIHLSLSPSS